MPLTLAPIIRRFTVDVFEFANLREDAPFVGLLSSAAGAGNFNGE
jgi:hypothetical protein